MTGNSVTDVVVKVFLDLLDSVLRAIPQFVAGLVILAVGLISASILKRLVEGILNLLMLDKWAEKANIAKGSEVRVWKEFIAQLVRWTVVILFLVPALDTWGVPRVTEVLDQLLLYLPKVIVAAVVGFVGIVIANLTYDFVKHAVKGLGATSANVVGALARYAILFFTALVVLNQLGVASELIQILFTGIVAMLALAGGLAFGLGGQDTARDILKGIRSKLEK
ncbi:hypothetical protein M1555_02205 [Patescibacteria group bacterium]|nr:hypothetical protein [Patescibacteria group bacterium]